MKKVPSYVSSEIPSSIVQNYNFFHSYVPIASHGDLQNDEKTANIIYGLISLVDTVDPAVFPRHGCQKIAISFEEFTYTVCQSNKKIYVVKRSNNGSGGDLIDIGS